MQNNNVRLHHFAQAGVTLATRPVKDLPDTRAVAIAVTHPGDTFTRRLGATVAVGRLAKRRDTSRNWRYVRASELRDAIRAARTLCHMGGSANTVARNLLKELVHHTAEA